MIAAKNKILRIFKSIGQILAQNRGLIRSNNTENGAKTDDLSAKRAKNTPQPQRRLKKPKNVQKWHFFEFPEDFL
ncbi:MAG: hypothetical protein V4547_11015 [Bacteroidota bacterium]